VKGVIGMIMKSILNMM